MTERLQRLGPFLIERELGRGGMGAVYAARNEETGEHVAIKVLPEHLADNPAFRVRFQNEIETLKKLSHPNIVRLFGFGEEGKTLYYVMELVEGKSLQDSIEEGKVFTWEEVTQIGIQVCRALKHAQDLGVIHRDLKPANLLMMPNGIVKLSDFGIAKLFGATQMTVDGGVVGTAHYMAPEQAEGERVTARSDLYSLGAVLYALLAGRPPHTGKSVAAILHAVRYEPPAPLRRLAPDVPEELEHIINQLLEKDPQDRIATPLAVAKRLQAMWHGLRAQPKPASSPGPKPTEISMDDLGATVAPGTASEEAPTVEGTPSQLGLPSLDDAEATRTAGLDDRLDDEYTIAPLEAPPTTSSHYVTVDEARAKERLLESHETGVPPWIVSAILGIILVVIVALAVYLLQPPSPAALWEEIQAAASDLETLEEKRHLLDQFLEDYPEHEQAAAARALREKLDRRRMERQFQRRVRRADDLEKLEPVERAYLQVLRDAPFHPEKALRQARALVTLYEPDQKRDRRIRRTVELAKAKIDQLLRKLERLRATEEAALQSRLELIEEVAAKDPRRALAMYESLPVLYGEYAWAAPFLRRAAKKAQALRENLGEPSGSTAPSPQDRTTRATISSSK